MSEPEWEGNRLPRRRATPVPGAWHPPNPPIDEYLALEMPRESRGWLLRPRYPRTP